MVQPNAAPRIAVSAESGAEICPLATTQNSIGRYGNCELLNWGISYSPSTIFELRILHFPFRIPQSAFRDSRIISLVASVVLKR